MSSHSSSARRSPAPASPARRLAQAQRFWQLPDADLARLLTLIGQVDRIELKLTVPADRQHAIGNSLKLRFPRHPTHLVYYLDGPDRPLLQQGIILRVRRGADRWTDSVVKLRPVEPRTLPAALRERKDFTVEVDGMPGHYVCSGALKIRLAVRDVQRALDRRQPLRTLFSAPQRRLLAARTRRAVDIDSLMLIGPVQAHRHTVTPDTAGRSFLAERWDFPDGSRILELSTRCAPDAAVSAAAQTAAVLRRHGIDLTWPQQTKTHTTMAFFADRHRRT